MTWAFKWFKWARSEHDICKSLSSRLFFLTTRVLLDQPVRLSGPASRPVASCPAWWRTSVSQTSSPVPFAASSRTPPLTTSVSACTSGASCLLWGPHMDLQKGTVEWLKIKEMSDKNMHNVNSIPTLVCVVECEFVCVWEAGGVCVYVCVCVCVCVCV